MRGTDHRVRAIADRISNYLQLRSHSERSLRVVHGCLNCFTVGLGELAAKLFHQRSKRRTKVALGIPESIKSSGNMRRSPAPIALSGSALQAGCIRSRPYCAATPATRLWAETDRSGARPWACLDQAVDEMRHQARIFIEAVSSIDISMTEPNLSSPWRSQKFSRKS